MTLREIAEQVGAAAKVGIVGAGSKAAWAGYPTNPPLPIRDYAGIIEHDADDQVVVLRAGTSLAEAQAALATAGQTIPLVDPIPSGTIGGLIAMNLPHLAEGRVGSWRDWVLGMTIVRADGTTAKCGSKAVKNVAGYDVQKLFIGSRGRWGVIAEVVLRAYPLAAFRRLAADIPPAAIEGPVAIQRVLRTDFAMARESLGTRVLASSSETGTLWIRDDGPIRRFTHNWLIQSSIAPVAPEPFATMDRRLAEIVDPTAKFS